ncbi:hypothetical protein [Kribbella sp. VKM Ac-2566]|uniref:hypothetical protein n=1 Tax=Kribbella sp. VKM Ac-2566 TaxID=2512218 RepID=UPI001EDD64CF|nr:hypothetical protein [Kribbella sp. VKM Ac-2566]
MAWLHEMRGLWWRETDKVFDSYPGQPARQLLGIVEMVRDHVAADGYVGCVYHNTAAEFRDPQHPGHQESVQHAAEIRKQPIDIARKANAIDPEELGDVLLLVIDGIYANGAVLGPSGPIGLGVALAEQVIERYCPATELRP